MRIMKSQALDHTWQAGDWDRALARLTLGPQLETLVTAGGDGPLQLGAPPFASFDVIRYVEPGVTDDALFLQAAKAALTLAARLEKQGAFRVLVRRDAGAAGASVTLRAFPRDASHPRTPGDVDTDASAWIMFVDTRRIDGARRA